MLSSLTLRADGCVDVSPDQNGGIYKCVQLQGLGSEHPPPGAVIYSHYHGTLADDTVFGSSRDAGRMWTYVIGIGESSTYRFNARMYKYVYC